MSPIDKYPLMSEMLSTLYSTDTGLERDAAKAMLQRTLNDVFRSRIEPELQSAFVDETPSWRELLWNDEYEVYAAASEEEARLVVKELLWDVVFPDTPLPSSPNEL